MSILDDLERANEAATDAPWGTRHQADGIPGWHLSSSTIETLADFGDGADAERDAALAALLRNAAPTLIAIARHVMDSQWEVARELARAAVQPLTRESER